MTDKPMTAGELRAKPMTEPEIEDYEIFSRMKQEEERELEGGDIPTFKLTPQESIDLINKLVPIQEETADDRGELIDDSPTKYIVSTNNNTASFSKDQFDVAVAYFTWKRSSEGDDCRLYLANPMIQIA